MKPLWEIWAGAAVAILVVAGIAGQGAKGTLLGLLIDERGRYSLNRFQLLWWLWIILSMAAGVAAVRFTVDGARPLAFSIPGPVLALLGTVGATTVASSMVKAHHDSTYPERVAAALPRKAFLGQLLLQEEGAGADQTLDVGKFQALVITVLLGLGYVLTAVYVFLGRDQPPITKPGEITQLPELDPTFVALLAVSAASYVGTKLITRAGSPSLSLDGRNQLARQVLDRERAKGEVVDGRRWRQLLRDWTPNTDDSTPGGAATQKATSDAQQPDSQIGGMRMTPGESGGNNDSGGYGGTGDGRGARFVRPHTQGGVAR